ncbi:hypothetical protein B0H14DRAFT_3712606, partial [Mycena olivaceomarginata]
MNVMYDSVHVCAKILERVFPPSCPEEAQLVSNDKSGHSPQTKQSEHGRHCPHRPTGGRCRCRSCRCRGPRRAPTPRPPTARDTVPIIIPRSGCCRRPRPPTARDTPPIIIPCSRCCSRPHNLPVHNGHAIHNVRPRQPAADLVARSANHVQRLPLIDDSDAVVDGGGPGDGGSGHGPVDNGEGGERHRGKDGWDVVVASRGLVSGGKG